MFYAIVSQTVGGITLRLCHLPLTFKRP